MGSPLHAPFSKLKYGVLNPPFITIVDWWSFNNTFIQQIKFSPKTFFLKKKHLIGNHDLKNHVLF